MAILEVKNVCKSFKVSKKAPEVEVLRNINFNIEKGEFVTLLGPSGCGKTTLLTMIGGFQTPTSGEVLLEGEKIEKPSSERGYVFQNYALFPWMNVEKNILYSLKFSKMNKEEKKKRLEELLEMSHLKGHEKKYPISLSGGMQQRVAVVRALAPNPKILLLDEPFSALDYVSRLMVSEDVKKIIKAEEKTVIMITHDLAEAISLADRIIVLSKRPSKIKTIYNIKIDGLTALERRKSNKFSYYYDLLWKELDKNV